MEEKPAFKLFVFIEFIPSLLFSALGGTLYCSHNISLEAALLLAVLGLMLHAILMLYRLMSGVILILTSFSDLPEVMPKIHDLLQGVLRPGMPQKPRS